MQGHPVNFLLPAVPVPPAHTVIESAVVEVIAIRIGRYFMYFFFNRGQIGREVQVRTVPGDLAMTVFSEVMVQSRSDRQAIVSTQNDLSTAAFHLKNIFTVFGRDAFYHKMRSVFG